MSHVELVVITIIFLLCVVNRRELMQDVAVCKRGPKSKISFGDREAGLHFGLHQQRPEADQLRGFGRQFCLVSMGSHG